MSIFIDGQETTFYTFSALHIATIY